MTDAPERVWLDWPGANKGEIVFDEPPESDIQAGQTEYRRADIPPALAEALAVPEIAALVKAAPRALALLRADGRGDTDTAMTLQDVLTALRADGGDK